MKKERFVMARIHGNSHEYCFGVKAGSTNISDGDYLVVDMLDGVGVARATTGVIRGENASYVAMKLGAVFPLTAIKCVIPGEMYKSSYTLKNGDRCIKLNVGK